MTDGRLARGERTRAAVLRRAADIASIEGLDGLTIGRLAADLQVSKAGVFAHFGSKEELQLATIRAASDRFVDAVVAPALDVPDGLGRLVALCDRFLAYSRRGVFPGGCFFFSVAAEYDAKPGRLRDEIAAARRGWLDTYAAVVAAAQRRGELDPEADPATVAFELDALGMAANLHARLCDDPAVYQLARESMLGRLRVLATGRHPALR
ncbi:MAG TPA: TetR/AcrR family transcriptional regulator [Acidimicrobiales bacterium]|nr:TetR/AcrR family transcriptional regulator [Acidimicrobiales bacterium]